MDEKATKSACWKDGVTGVPGVRPLHFRDPWRAPSAAASVFVPCSSCPQTRRVSYQAFHQWRLQLLESHPARLYIPFSV